MRHLARALEVIPPGETFRSRRAWWRRLNRTIGQHPDWAAQPMPSGVPHQLVKRKVRQ